MKNNKYILLAVLLTVLLFGRSDSLFAQQDPLYTHYMFNKMIYNPAYAGTNRQFMCATFLLHNQWTGFEGTQGEFSGIAPQTQTFSFNAPIPSANPNSLFSGLGLVIINDKLGYDFTTVANLVFSLKKHFSFGTLQLGVNGGMIQRGINNTSWRYPDSPDDPKVPSGEYNAMIPDLGTGLYLFAPDKYYIGFSAQHLLGGQFKWGGTQNTLVKVFYLTAGYNFALPTNPDIEFQPSFLFKIDPSKTQFDINTNIVYKQRFWGGLQYRQGDAVSALLGMRLTDQLKFGYSFDLTTTELLKYSNGTHEIFISYCFTIKTKERVIIPNIIWTPRYL